MELYRAAARPEIRSGDCLTDDLAIAREYAAQRGYGHVYRVEVSERGDWAADAEIMESDRAVDTREVYVDDLETTVTQYDPEPYEGRGHVYAAVDRTEVRALLIERGYVAAQYYEPWTTDERGEAGSHWTLVVLDPAIVTDVTEIAHP